MQGAELDGELLFETTERVCTITINRPARRNALSPDVMRSLASVLDRLRQSDEVRAVVIRGVGQEAFSAGYDLNVARPKGTAVVAEDAEQRNPIDVALDAVAAYPYPVIAMVYGYCYGAGCELAAGCDIRLAADNARFSMPPAKLGVLYRPAGLQRFLDVIGPAYTKELFFTGRAFDAERAREIGFAQHVLPAAELEPFATTMAREIAENAPLSLKGTKTIVARLQAYRRLRPEDEAELQALLDVADASEDVKEGRLAFKEKRKPRFVGR